MRKGARGRMGICCAQRCTRKDIDVLCAKAHVEGRRCAVPKRTHGRIQVCCAGRRTRKDGDMLCAGTVAASHSSDSRCVSSDTMWLSKWRHSHSWLHCHRFHPLFMEVLVETRHRQFGKRHPVPFNPG
ncbi:hypothetical protein FQA47_012745 [Oryzias melastigma]|uniref:Uncharacterized protein n=1 Tax=Oryzias melastigma TaxID=30732 RepID=A0A834FI59_ORYME|nr:hypothetical protein FQA47_012745 [Oryzias melastigma]